MYVRNIIPVINAISKKIQDDLLSITYHTKFQKYQRHNYRSNEWHKFAQNPVNFQLSNDYMFSNSY